MVRERVELARERVVAGASVRAACAATGISTSSYYRRRKTRAPVPLVPEIECWIRQTCERYPAFGHRKITAVLRRQGVRLNHKLVFRYMRRLELLQPRRRARSAPTPRLPICCPLASNVRWEIDIKSEVLANGSWAFLIAVLDAFDRQLPAWAIGDHCRAEETIAVLEAALLQRFDGPVPGPLELELRADRGSQFVAERFKHAARALGVTLAFCGVRASNDKPYVEAFFSVVERELLEREPSTLDSLLDFRSAFADFLDVYHCERPIGTARYRTPNELALLGGAFNHRAPEATLLRRSA